MNFGKLILSIILDLVGWLSYAIPFLGEFLDVIWAPFYGLILYIMYDNVTYSMIGLAEEILPGTDIVPSATIFWFIETFGRK